MALSYIRPVRLSYCHVEKGDSTEERKQYSADMHFSGGLSF